MQVLDWMTAPAVTVSPYCPALLAYHRMLERQIRRLPVVNDEGELVGIVTDRDLRGLLLANLRPDGEAASPGARDDLVVEDLMTREVLTVEPSTDIRVAALLMHDHKVGGLPVMEGSRCAGIITISDLLEILVGALEPQLGASQRTDLQRRRRPA